MKLGRKTDLNNVVKNGIYYYSVNSKMINTPSGKEDSSGNLFVLEQDKENVLQSLISFGNLYCRQKIEIGEWTPWINLSAGCEAYDLPIASYDKLGGVKIGDGIKQDREGRISVDEYSLPSAKKDRLGGIKVGKNLSISVDGTLSANDQIYCLPQATQNRLGGIRLGSGLYVDELGRTCVSMTPISEKVSTHVEEKVNIIENPYTLPIASSEQLGGVKIGKNLEISSDGTLSARPTEELKIASTDELGGIRVDGKVFQTSEEGFLQIDPSHFLPSEEKKKKEFSYEVNGEFYAFSFTLEDEINFLNKVIAATMSQMGILGGTIKPFEVPAKNKDDEDVILQFDSTSLLDLYVNGVLDN